MLAVLLLTQLLTQGEILVEMTSANLPAIVAAVTFAAVTIAILTERCSSNSTDRPRNWRGFCTAVDFDGICGKQLGIINLGGRSCYFYRW